MKVWCLLAALLLMAVSIPAAQNRSSVTFVDHEKVAATIANASGGALASGPDFSININRRAGPGQVEVHDKETDTFYVLEGEATLVTGGTMIGGRVSRPNQQLGTDIQGGETHHLSKGDVIAIPAGVPHWFKEVPKGVTYYTVKSIKP
jgi:mannose-6-phosphate isomerase-like protein (cupin superfamily)